MRVLIDTSFARRGPSGTGVYIDRLVQALGAEGVDVVETANERRLPPAGGGLGSVRNLAQDARWIQVELPRRARVVEADVLHHPLPDVALRCRSPQVVTVHDLGLERIPALFDPRFRAVGLVTQRVAARRAAAVVCPSERTALDLRALWGIDPARIVVAPHGPGQSMTGADASKDGGAHFLYIGDDEPRKNLSGLLAGYRRYRDAETDPLPLVLAGSASGDGDGEGVQTERDPSPQRLSTLLAGARALVHPALHEGFGLTLLEAMSAGVPVVAAASPGVVETCGGAARLFDPRDPEAIAAALRAVGGDAGLRADLSERGRRHAAGFSWRRSARAHVEAYTLAAGS